MDKKILDLLFSKLQEHIKSQAEVLCDGSAKSYEHYKELCGFIRGLQTAQYEIGDLVRKLKDSDDD
jgi:hypothetical protein